MTDLQRLVVYLPQETKDSIRELAFDKRKSQSQLAADVLTNYLNENIADVSAPSTPD